MNLDQQIRNLKEPYTLQTTNVLHTKPIYLFLGDDKFFKADFNKISLHDKEGNKILTHEYHQQKVKALGASKDWDLVSCDENSIKIFRQDNVLEVAPKQVKNLYVNKFIAVYTGKEIEVYLNQITRPFKSFFCGQVDKLQTVGDSLLWKSGKHVTLVSHLNYDGLVTLEVPEKSNVNLIGYQHISFPTIAFIRDDKIIMHQQGKEYVIENPCPIEGERFVGNRKDFLLVSGNYIKVFREGKFLQERHASFDRIKITKTGFNVIKNDKIYSYQDLS